MTLTQRFTILAQYHILFLLAKVYIIYLFCLFYIFIYRIYDYHQKLTCALIDIGILCALSKIRDASKQKRKNIESYHRET